MKQTIEIEIEVPEWHKAVYNEQTQKVEIVKVNLPKSWEEFCEENPVKRGEYFIQDGVIMSVVIGGLRDTTTKSVLPNKETAEAFLALMQLIQLRDCYRQGWKPDWEQPYKKYCIYYGSNSVYISDSIYRSIVLSFQSAEIRDEFRKNFKDLIEKAKELI